MVVSIHPIATPKRSSSEDALNLQIIFGKNIARCCLLIIKSTKKKAILIASFLQEKRMHPSTPKAG